MPDNDGSVRWDELVAAAQQMIRDVYAEKDETEDDAGDWCELPAAGALTYWYNKKSGKAQWSKPQAVTGRGPDIKDDLTKKSPRQIKMEAVVLRCRNFSA